MISIISDFLFICFKIAPKNSNTHTKKALQSRAPHSFQESFVRKVRCLMMVDKIWSKESNLQSDINFMHMCAWFDAVRWHRTGIDQLKMADREHISLTRQVHVVCEPLGQSEHKRALPLHLVTRPAPCRHPRLQAGQCSCAVNASESQCVFLTIHAPQLSPALLQTVHAPVGGPIPKKSLCCWLVTKLKLHLVNHAEKC